MSTEPERDIEKVLRASAKKRREDAGAPLELHPATRRLLHGEVARLRPNIRGTSNIWFRMLAGSRMRLVLNVSAVALLLLVASVLLLPSLSKSKSKASLVGYQLAMQDKSRTDRPAPTTPAPEVRRQPGPTELPNRDGFAAGKPLPSGEPKPQSAAGSSPSESVAGSVAKSISSDVNELAGSSAEARGGR